jgi:hypothetical protein
MKSSVLTVVLAAALAAPLAATARADRGDDDLAAVKKAVGGAPAPSRMVAQAEAPEARPSRPAAEQEEARPARPAKAREGKWLRVRITERAGKHGKVSINLPLGLARAFGEDWPVHDCESCGSGRKVTLGDVLRALDTGQSLVEIDDDEASVRVWVD